MIARPRRMTLIAAVVAGCALLAACGSATPDGSATPKGGATASAAPATTAPADGGGAPAAVAIDPCTLLTPADGQAALHKALGTGRKVSAGDLDECVYDAAGPLVVAVLRQSFAKDSFQRMIETQNKGPYAKTTGPGVALTGLGDAAYTFAKAGIVEVLKNATVISITSASTAASEQIARAVLPKLP